MYYAYKKSWEIETIYPSQTIFVSLNKSWEHDVIMPKAKTREAAEIFEINQTTCTKLDRQENRTHNEKRIKKQGNPWGILQDYVWSGSYGENRAELCLADCHRGYMIPYIYVGLVVLKRSRWKFPPWRYVQMNISDITYRRGQQGRIQRSNYGNRCQTQSKKKQI